MKRLDHILIRVDDLEKCVNDFRKAGFKVYFGTNIKDSYNAMIYFQDKIFIELIDTNKFPKRLVFLAKTRIINLLGAFYKRIGRYTLSKDTFLDYAIYSSNIEEHHDAVKKQVSRLHHLSRIDSFGRALKWKLFVFKKMHLPLVMSKYVPCKYPETDAYKHRNKVFGIHELNIGTTMDLLTLKEDLVDVFNLPEQNIFLEDNKTLKVITQNSIIRYRQGQKNKIIGIQLDSFTPNAALLLSEYGLFCK